MKQERWEKENNVDQNKNRKINIACHVLAIATIVIALFSCGKSKVKELVLDKSRASLIVGETDKLYVSILPQDIHPVLLWKSSDESVAKVDSGVVTGLKAGKVRISVTVIDQADMSAECEYLVEEPSLDMETLDILEEPIVLRPGGHQQLKVSFTPENQNEMILWSSTNESVARVSPRGKVEALRVGVAFIIAKSDRTGVSDTATVSVEGAGVVPNMPAGQAQSSQASPATVAKPNQVPVSNQKSAQTTVVNNSPAKTVKAAPAKATATTSARSSNNVTTTKSTPVTTTKSTSAKPSTATPARSANTGTTKKTSSVTSTKTTPVTTTKPVKSSGIKNLGYANFRGSWPNDVNGRMEFKSTHVIDSKDAKGRMASPGDYVIGEWSDGHLVQGIWYGSDNQVKGSILIGK